MSLLGKSSDAGAANLGGTSEVREQRESPSPISTPTDVSEGLHRGSQRRERGFGEMASVLHLPVWEALQSFALRVILLASG
jgi:hypothetical protein